MLYQALMVVIILVPILFLAYITTRLVAGKSARAMKGRHIDIVETVNLGVDKKLHLIKVGGKYILISSGGKNVEFLSEIPAEDVEDLQSGVIQTQTTAFDFKKLFDKYIQFNKEKRTEPVTSDDQSNGDGLEKGSSIRNNLNRLKAINSSMEGRGRQNGDE